jgi:DNA-binding NarL/FixJ family response regulator
MEPRVLILEDVALTRLGLELMIHDIEPKWKKRLGIGECRIDTAGCAAVAYQLLERAIANQEPYDIFILDLSIPEGRLPETEPGGDIEEDLLWVHTPGNGMEVLRYVRRTESVKEVIVYSGFPHYDYVAEAFRLGIVDFIAKGADEKNISDVQPLQKAVLAAWERVMAKEYAQTLEKRFQTLVPYAEQVLTYQFSISFNSLVGLISQETEAMKVSIAERLSLDVEKDAHDPLLWRVATIQNSVAEARRNWDTLPQVRSSEAEREDLKEVVVEDELKKIFGDVLHSLTFKHMETNVPPAGETRVLSFAEDVPTILREIIVGSLGEVREKDELILGEMGSPAAPNGDEDWKVTMKIDVRVEGKQAEVRFQDNLQPLDPGVAESINKGFDIVTDSSFGRAWGLSIAQHAARRGAARVFVEPLAEGNRISYFIPIIY